MITKLLAMARSLGVGVVTATLPEGLLGCYVHDLRRIYLTPRLTPFERCVVLAHELGHAHFGHSCRNGLTETNSAHEFRADRYAARVLIDESELAALERVCDDPYYLADELGVTVHFLEWYREHHLTRLADSTYADAREGLGQFGHRQIHELIA